MHHNYSNTIAKNSSSTLTGELALEQRYVDMLYRLLDAQRASSAGRLAAVDGGPTVDNDQAASERESFSRMYTARAAQLDAAERNLCFGRLDLDHAERRYVGRIGLRDEDYEAVLVDWRAPAAQPFYRATAVDRHGVTRRRHLQMAGRRVVRIDDDVLDLGSVEEATLTGEAALLASLRRSRTGRMSDIVATIQADQDRVIRSDLKGILVVDGGPGTGKTVVALHRAAYLLYTYREQLEKRGILVIGPNSTFMRYIDQVLPSLGENDVVLATVDSLYPGVRVTAEDSPETATIKGDRRMIDVIARAVADRQQVPAEPVKLRIDGQDYVLDPRACRRARDKARRQPLPHNRARRVFVDAMLTSLTRQVVGARLMRPEDLADFRAELAAEPVIRQAFDVLWPELGPQQLLASLYASPERLHQAAPDLTEDERTALSRPNPTAWTSGDVPLLDEAAELLGELDATRAAAAERRSRNAAEEAAATEYARELVAKLREDDAITVPVLEVDDFVEVIAGRNVQAAPEGSIPERALADREWTYGHVIVDEAQELSAMAWRMLVRRCPARSMTVVGDLAQASSPGSPNAWSEVLDPIAAGRWRSATLRLNYRTPRPAMEAAAAVLDANDPPVAVRDSDEQPWLVLTGTTGLPEVLDDAVRRELDVIGAGQLAVIAPERLVETVLPQATGPVLEASVAVMTPVQAKGLEFDAVVVVDPAGMIAADLYVALTRTTRRLGVIAVDTVPLPLATITQGGGR